MLLLSRDLVLDSLPYKTYSIKQTHTLLLYGCSVNSGGGGEFDVDSGTNTVFDFGEITLFQLVGVRIYRYELIHSYILEELIQ